MAEGESLPGLRLPTLMNYATLLVRLLLNIGSSIIIARSLPVDQYGLWGVVLSIINSLTTFVGPLTWWAPRQAVWGRRAAGLTGLAVALLYGLLSTGVFALAASRLGGWGPWVAAGATATLAATASLYLIGLCSASEPTSPAVWNVIFETSRLASLYITLVLLRWGITGALASLAVAHAAGAIYLLLVALSRGLIAAKLDFGLARRMMRAFHAQLPGVLAGFLSSLYRVYLEAVGTPLEAIARFNVGLSAEAPLARLASSTSPALYARMLRRITAWDVEESLRLYLLFNGFITFTMIALARPIAAIFNPHYLDAAPIVVVVSVHALLLGFYTIYSTAIAGYERFDYIPEQVPGFMEVLKRPWSRPGIAGSLGRLVSYAVYLIIAALAPAATGNPWEAALAAAAAYLLGTLAFTLYTGRLAHRLTGARFPWRILAEALAASSAAAGVYAVTGAAWAVTPRFWPEARILAAALLEGAAAYGAVFLAVSPWARGLLVATLRRLGPRR